MDELNPYFLGSIVLVKGDSPDAQIIDGQQRLTTLAILLSVIRSKVGAKYAEGLTRLIKETGNPITGTPDRHRLTLRELDAQFFRQYVQDEAAIEKLLKLDRARLSDSQCNIRDNAALFDQRLQGWTEEQCVRLAQFVATRCFLVVVSTSDFDSAYRIFSVLNTRGLDLSDADILKAEIIGRITPVSRRDEYTKKWVEAEEALGREPFNDLFAHIRMIHRKAKARGTVLAEIHEYAKPTANPTLFIDDELLPYAEAFKLLRVGPFRAERGAEEANKILRWLRRLDNVDWIPPAILYLTRHREDSAAIGVFLKDLERLAAAMWVLGVYINERIERYGALITEIERGDDLSQGGSALQLRDAERQNIVRLLDGPVYLMQAKVRSYVLLRLDEALTERGAEYEREYVTVEHVLPQQPSTGSQWLVWFPDEALRTQWVHRLANLVLLSQRKNSAASNYDFEAKKERYFAPRRGTTPFALTAQVLSERDWTREVLQRRQADLVAKLREVWRL